MNILMAITIFKSMHGHHHNVSPVKIDPPHSLVCYKKRLNGVVFRVRPKKRQVRHDKDPSLLKGPEHRA
jgi:hypothetical protein